ncbi:hypothetical protein J6A31_06010 [bacterium]|nr:hypothetical protein [bacterium]
MVIGVYNFFEAIDLMSGNPCVDEFQPMFQDTINKCIYVDDKIDIKIAIISDTDDISSSDIYGIAIYATNCMLLLTSGPDADLSYIIGYKPSIDEGIATLGSYCGTNVDVYRTLINRPYIYLMSIYVTSDMRGLGLFRKLFDTILSDKTTEAFVLIETLFGSINSVVPPGYLYNLYVNKYGFIKIGYEVDNTPHRIYNFDNSYHLDINNEIFNVLIKTI